MSEHSHPHIIIGAGLSGASPVKSIRELDQKGSILLLALKAFLERRRH